MYHFIILKMRVSMNGEVGCKQKNIRKCHGIKRISTFTSSKTSLENAREIRIFQLPSVTIKL